MKDLVENISYVGESKDTVNISDPSFRFPKYTQEQFTRFAVAKAILGKVTVICTELLYHHAKTEEEQSVIVKFEEPYIIMRINLTIEDSDEIEWIYKEVHPLVSGDIPKLTFDYILTHPNNGKIY